MRLVLLAAVCLWASSGSAATIRVTTSADELNADGDCSLREAVRAANTNAAVDACAAGISNGNDYIDIAAISGQTVTLTLGEIVVTGATRFGPENGPAVATLTIDAGGASRIFAIDTQNGNSEVVRFQRLTLRNGSAERGGAVLVPAGDYAEFDGCTFTDNRATGSTTADGGGAIYTAGSVAVLNGTFTGNTALNGSANGGAILNAAGGSLQVLNNGGSLVLSQNRAARAGGAIETAGPLFIDGGAFTSNAAGLNGGAVHVTGANTATIVGGAFSQNSAGMEGGALWNSATGTLQAINAQITGNTAAGPAADQGGGGVFSDGGTTVLFNATLRGNAATGAAGSGGGVLNTAGGRLTVTGGTIVANTAVRAGGGIETNAGAAGNTATLTNVAITGNTAGSAPGFGGGIHVTGAATVEVTGGTISGNTAVVGGGLWVSATGRLTARSGTVIAENTATGAAAGQGGGGLYVDGGAATLVDVEVRDNLATGAAGAGGGVLVRGGSLSVSGSLLVQRNQASRAGGGIALDGTGAPVTATITGTPVSFNTVGAASGTGGGIHAVGAVTVTLTNATVGSNTAVVGGGIYLGSGSTLVARGATLSTNVATGATAGQGGGGLYLGGGAADVAGSLFSFNSATGARGSGGGLFNAGGTVTVRRTEFRENQARGSGGAVEEAAAAPPTGVPSRYVAVLMRLNRAGADTVAGIGDGGAFHLTGAADVEVDSSTVSANTATRDGGAFWAAGGGRLIVNASSVEENAAVRGGAAFFSTAGEGVVAFFRSLIAGNTASVAGGGVFSDGGRGGVQISTLSGNRAPRGGGLFNAGGSVTVIDATVAGNVATVSGGGLAFAGAGNQTAMSNSILADNVAPTGADCFGYLLTLGPNLIETPEGCGASATISGVDPGLQPLADNGGATRTHALTAASPAARAGQTTSPFDQRGYTRDAPQSIGAYEFDGVVVADEPGPVAGAAPAVFALSAPAPNPFRNATTLRFTVATAGPVELALYDTIGRRLQTLYAGAPGAAAAVEVTVDGASLSPGVYVVRLTSASGTATQRLTVIR